jgi:hypothetical protein
VTAQVSARPRKCVPPEDVDPERADHLLARAPKRLLPASGEAATRHSV